MAPPLEERFYETQRAQLLRWLPWLHLFRAFRIALDVRKILLGTLAAIALYAGDALIDALPFAPQQAGESGTPLIYLHDLSWKAGGVQLNVDDLPFANSGESPDIWPRVLRPISSVVNPGARLFQRGNSWADAGYAWTQLLFRLAVWSLLGGAIARMAAVQFARRESLTAWSAMRFSTARFGTTIGAPLLPLVFIGFFWVVCLLLGLIGRIPEFGPTIVGTLWFVPLLIGIVLAVILLVIAVSWPLMVATISTEGTDAFDALSRGYDYVLNRTGYALWLLFLTVIYGAIVLLLAGAVTNGAVQLAQWSVGSSMGDQLQELTPLQSPLPGDPTQVGESGALGFAGSAAAFWVRGLSWLLQGLEISFFWTATAIVYLLLRLSLDAKPLDEVYVPASERKNELPLVGIAASEQREQERAESTGESSDSAQSSEAPQSTDS